MNLDWTHGLKDNSKPYIDSMFLNKKNLKFLEIGLAAGFSTNWFINNYLQDKDSFITGIDPFLKLSESTGDKEWTCQDHWCNENLENIFKKNTEHNKNKIFFYKGFSKDILPKLDKNYYDLVYIDGDHSENAVFLDGCLSFDLIKHNGLIIFDDAQKNYTSPEHPNGNTEKGVQRFLKKYDDKVKILFNGYQCVVQKL